MNGRIEDLEALAGQLVRLGRQSRNYYFWHLTTNKYVIFLAEFFLRRSNRSTVARFLPTFITEYPDFSSLAGAEPSCVVADAHWAGLSSRVRRLPQIAEAILREQAWSADALLDLPYIGPYAAQAIALYAYDEPNFPIDNNVRRVVGRYLSLQDESDLLTTVRSLQDHILHEGDIDRLKSAHRGVLALGWNSCRTRPSCETCVLARGCKSYREVPPTVDVA